VAKFGSFREDFERQSIARESSVHRLWRIREGAVSIRKKEVVCALVDIVAVADPWAWLEATTYVDDSERFQRKTAF
jgi:hypothetical protein